MARSLLLVWSCLLVLNYASVHGDPNQDSQGDHANITETLYERNNGFAFNLYKTVVSKMASQSDNVFFSPLSVYIALAAISLGAGGKTQEQLLSALAFHTCACDEEELHRALFHLLQTFNKREGVGLETGTALYVRDSFKPNPTFLEKLKHFYVSDGFSVDFTKTTETTDQINAYVSEKTHGKISNFVQNLDPDTIMFLISYIYFKGKWAIPFDPTDTKEDRFHVDKDTTVKVQMMKIKEQFYSYHDRHLSADVLRLKYDNFFSMMLVLPKNITALEDGIDLAHINRWQKWMVKSELLVFIPKLSLKTSYSLKDVLKEMGMSEMFTHNANFTRITDDNSILVTEAVHKATLDVDEAGTTATAVTGILFGPKSMQIPATLKFDQPFMVFIIDEETKHILFMGKIVDPTKK